MKSTKGAVMYKKILFTSILYLFAIGTIFSLQGISYDRLWRDFYTFSQLSKADSDFPAIEPEDIALANPEIQKVLLRIGAGNSISLEGYFQYYKASNKITGFIRGLDQQTGGNARNDYGAVLNNLQKIEATIASPDEAIIICLTFFQFHGISYLTTSAFISELEGNLYRLPDYLRNNFFSSFREVLGAAGNTAAFNELFTQSTNLLFALVAAKQITVNTAPLVKADIGLLKGLMAYYAVNECLTIYRNLNNLYFTAQTGSRTLAEMADGIISGDSLSRLSLDKKRANITEDWKTISGFLINYKIQSNEAMAALRRLVNDTQLYLPVQSRLSLYLTTYFPLQYKTTLPEIRVIYLFSLLSKTYPTDVLNDTAEVFLKHSGFITAHTNNAILNTIDLCYAKKQHNFRKSFGYLVMQTNELNISLKDMHYIYENLTAADIDILVYNEIPLNRFTKIIEAYWDTIGYHLPLFARVYKAAGATGEVTETFNLSLPFHEAFSIRELNQLTNIWGSSFASTFYFLLQSAVLYHNDLMPLTNDKKRQLFIFIDLIARHALEFAPWLHFHLVVFPGAALEDDTIKLTGRILTYQGNDSAGKKIFTDYYLELLEQLNTAYHITAVEAYAYLLIDISKGCTYAQADTARVLKKNLVHLQSRSNLEKMAAITKQINYAPDIFLTLDRLAIGLAESNTDVLSSYLAEFADTINNDIFTWALDSVNLLFPVKDYFSVDTLSLVHQSLAALPAERRKTIINMLNRITYLKQEITDPAAFAAAIPLLTELADLDSDLFEEFFLDTIPALNHLITSTKTLLGVFSALEKANRALITAYPTMRENTPRIQFFAQILPSYTHWIDTIPAIQPAISNMFLPLAIWNEDTAAYLAALSKEILTLCNALPSPAFAENFIAIKALLSISKQHTPFLQQLVLLSKDFLGTNSLDSLYQYIEAVKTKKIAVESGKKRYFTKLSSKDRTRLNALLNRALAKRSFVSSQLTAKAVFDLVRRQWLAGGAWALHLAFSGNYLNYNQAQFIIEAEYLINTMAPAQGLAFSVGFLLPAGARGLTQATDYNSHFKLGITYGLAITQSQILEDNIGWQLGFGLDFITRQEFKWGIELGYEILSHNWPRVSFGISYKLL